MPAIGALLAARGSATYVRALEQQRAVLADERRAAQHRLDLIDRMRDAHQKELTMSTTIDEHPFEARHVVALRGTIPSYADEQLLGDRFFPELGKQQITPSGVCGSIDLADEYQEEDVDKEVFFEVGADVAAAEPLAIRDLPAQRAARATFTGPYPEIGDACDQLVRWAADRGNTNPGAGGLRYLYLNDVRTTPPEQLITEIYLPIGD